MPMLVDGAWWSVARGCVWRRCRCCDESTAMTPRVVLCCPCVRAAGRRGSAR